ncbi:MAG TPA: sulfotransferase [Mycobacteriales bacterium]|nr:sulfotransferase [Mycobacteriales bacterium]
MALQVVGAGLGRTGTNSLKLALEKLLGEPCYHMLEVFQRPEHVDKWASAYDGTPPDWEQLYAGFGATVDWPSGPFWAPIAEAYPDALILLSVRDADAWWKSASSTIFQAMAKAIDADPEGPWTQMASRMLASFTPNWRDEAAAKEAFLAHYDQVRRTAPPDRLLEWQPSDGWGPICERLGLPVPDEPFPHVNTTEDFRAMLEQGEPS